MAKVVVMPQLGNSVESCLITSWGVAVGDRVSENQVICQVETDKASMEVPATAAGVVLKLLWKEGDEVPVKEPILVVGEAGEALAPEQFGRGSEEKGLESVGHDSEPQPEISAQRAPSAEGIRQGSIGGVSPRARRAAAEKGLNLDQIETGTGPDQRVIECDVLAAQPAGSGIGGRRTSSDQVVYPSGGTSPDTINQSTADFPGPFTDTDLKGVRRIVAERMMASLSSTAQLTYTSSADATALLALRARLKGTEPELGLNQITIGDLVGFAVVKTLPKHPAHNAHLVDGRLRTFAQIHLGFACDTPRGLLVPTIRRASEMSLREFAAASRKLAEEAVVGRIDPDLLSGATFTISNLGSFGVESFTPLLNLPQTAILGVDAIFPRAIVNPDTTFGVQSRIGLSLTADHQVIDGADAARFLRDLVGAIESIDLTVLR